MINIWPQNWIYLDKHNILNKNKKFKLEKYISFDLLISEINLYIFQSFINIKATKYYKKLTIVYSSYIITINCSVKHLKIHLKGL